VPFSVHVTSAEPAARLVCVVLGIKARISSVDGAVEGEHVYPAEQSPERPAEQNAQSGQVAAETVRVSDQLDLGMHTR
jgi:hypothetical protein